MATLLQQHSQRGLAALKAGRNVRELGRHAAKGCCRLLGGNSQLFGLFGQSFGGLLGALGPFAHALEGLFGLVVLLGQRRGGLLSLSASLGQLVEVVCRLGSFGRIYADAQFGN
ncbi:hypothetical protein D9M71_656630 [compost metagenome]